MHRRLHDYNILTTLRVTKLLARLGDSQIVPLPQQHNRRVSDGDEEKPRLSAEGGTRYRKRALLMVLTAAVLWIALYAIAKLLFH